MVIGVRIRKGYSCCEAVFLPSWPGSYFLGVGACCYDLLRVSPSSPRFPNKRPGSATTKSSAGPDGERERERGSAFGEPPRARKSSLGGAGAG